MRFYENSVSEIGEDLVDEIFEDVVDEILEDFADEIFEDFVDEIVDDFVDEMRRPAFVTSNGTFVTSISSFRCQIRGIEVHWPPNYRNFA